MYLQGHGYAPTFTVRFPDGQMRTSTVQWRPDNPQTLLSSGVARIDPPAGSYPNATERRQHEIAIQGLLAPTEQLDGALLSSRFPALDNPAVAVDIYRGDTGLDTGRPQSLFALDPRLLEQGRLTKEKRVNLRAAKRSGSRRARGPEPSSASTARCRSSTCRSPTTRARVGCWSSPSR